jgi:uncharacterized DUF497 family protein
MELRRIVHHDLRKRVFVVWPTLSREACNYINDVILVGCMIRFEWDPAKARANARKHGISFEIALHVFEDPDALVEQDRIEGVERRWQTLGLVEGVLLLLAAQTVQFEDDEHENIRIISARRADGKERKRYEKERQKNHGS